MSPYFTSNSGDATVIFKLQSMDYDEKKFTYSRTSIINNSTVWTVLDIFVNFYDGRYLDNALAIKFSFTLSNDLKSKLELNQTEK